MTETSSPVNGDNASGTVHSSDPAHGKKRSSHRAMIVVGVVLLICAVAGFGFFMRDVCARSTVHKYFAALQKGNAGAAINLFDYPIRYYGEPLLSDDIYSRATDRPQNMKISSIHWIHLTEAKIGVNYTQGSEQVTDSVDVYKIGGHWRMNTYYDNGGVIGGFNINILSGQQPLIVNGQFFTWDSNQSYAAFPGVYTVSRFSQNKWIASTSSKFSVFPQNSHEKSGSVSNSSPYYIPAPELIATVKQQIGEELKECAAQNTPTPLMSGHPCPFTMNGVSQGNITWKITQQPALTINCMPGGNNCTIPQSAQGTATAVGTVQDVSGNNIAVDSTINFKIYGYVTISGNSVFTTIFQSP